MRLNLFLKGLTTWLGMVCCVAASALTPIKDYGDPHAAAFFAALKARQSPRPPQEPLRMMQLGDSHTAGDYFTGRLRELLQQAFGNAGIGWLPPGNITNQRSSFYRAKNLGAWELWDSKQPSQDGVFPLGGFYQVTPRGGRIQYTAKNPLAPGQWRLYSWTQAQGYLNWRVEDANGQQQRLQPKKDRQNPWDLSSITTSADALSQFTLLAPRASALAGLALERQTPGVILDAIGTNGARNTQIGRWDPHALRRQMAWRNPQLIILAYGTNEAFDSKFNPSEYEAELRDTLKQLRYYAPNAALLVISAPSSAKPTPPNSQAGCSSPLAVGLTSVLAIQQRLAQQEHTLFWSWADYMGGPCGAPQWLTRTPALMGKDLIHLSKEGYEYSAEGLYKALMGELEKY